MMEVDHHPTMSLRDNNNSNMDLEEPGTEDDAALWEPFLQAVDAIATSSSLTAAVSAARALVVKVTSHAPLFAGYAVFAERLSKAWEQQAAAAATTASAQPQQQQQQCLQTLHLFAYGTWSDYQQQQQQQQASSSSSAADSLYMPLTDAQQYKLRQLTVLSLLADQCRQKQTFLSYAAVQEALQLPSLQAVEALLMVCLYAGVVQGRLCQKTQALLLTGAIASRDVPATAVPQLLQQVRQLMQQVRAAQDSLATEQLVVQSARQQDAQFWKHYTFYQQQQHQQQQQQQLQRQDIGGGGGAGAAGGGGGGLGLWRGSSGPFGPLPHQRSTSGGAAATAAAAAAMMSMMGVGSSTAYFGGGGSGRPSYNSGGGDGGGGMTFTSAAAASAADLSRRQKRSRGTGGPPAADGAPSAFPL